MATARIIADASPYYTIRVTVDGRDYDQQIISTLRGKALAGFLQTYAADYAAGLTAEWEAAQATRLAGEPAEEDPYYDGFAAGYRAATDKMI